MKYRYWRRGVAIALAAMCGISALPASETVRAADDPVTLPKPAYLWDFETVNDKAVSNSGSVAEAPAQLKGTAAIAEEKRTIGDQTYSKDSNHVLKLAGGDKGSSYADLPADIYSGISSSTGLTWSFWMKADKDVVRYSRVFSSVNSSSKNEFAYTPFDEDSVWAMIFDDGDVYRQTYGSEPEKGIWNYITVSISEDRVVCYVNGEKVPSSMGAGSQEILKNRLDALPTLVKNSLGRTNSTWSDKDCEAELDDVALYQKVLTAEEVAALARTYGFDPKIRETEKAQEGIYQTGEELTQVESLTTTSVDFKNMVKIWTDDKGKYYYSVSRNGKPVIECSALGLKTKTVDFTEGAALDEASVQLDTGKETYDLIQGSTSHVDSVLSETQSLLFSSLFSIPKLHFHL